MPTETAWKARFARLWNASEKSGVTTRALAPQRVLVALEAYRQVALPGLPGAPALGRVASVNEETARRALAALKAEQGSAP